MRRWITDTLGFLLRLSGLALARLLLVLLCVAEVAVVCALWVVAFIQWQTEDRRWALMLPVGATLFVIVQVALWQFAWLRLAQRGGRWRALAEYFTIAVRYPLVRTPHPWE